MVKVLALTALAATGCSDTPTQMPRSPIAGTVHDAYVSATGTEMVVKDVSAVGFQALVRDPAAATGYTAYPATGPVLGSADGQFTIPDVPEGDLLLAILVDGQPPELRAFHDHAVDVVYVDYGRAHATPAMSPALLEMNLSGLGSWVNGDALIAWCSQVGTEFDFVEGALSPPPNAGGSTIDGVFDWAASSSYGDDAMPRLMDPAKGDMFTVARLSPSQRGSHGINTMTQQARVAAPAQQQGQQSLVALSMADVSLDQHVELTASFHAALTAPDSAAHAYTTNWAARIFQGDLVDKGIMMGLSVFAIGGTEADVTESADFGLPFSPSPVGVSFTFSRQAMVSVNGSPGELVDTQYTLGPLSGSAYTAPDVDLFADARIDSRPIPGLALQVDGPAEVLVLLPAGIDHFTLELVTADSFPRVVARFVSDGSRLDVPADILTPGTYVLRIFLDGQDGSTYLGSITNLGPVTVAR